MGSTRPCALQTWYNLVEREKLEGPLRDVALANGLGIIPFYGLANGFLTGKYRTREDFGKSTRGDRVEGYLEGKGMRVLAALDRMHAETGAPLAAIALAWTNAQPGIVATLASATSVAQLEELIEAMDLELSARAARTARRGERRDRAARRPKLSARRRGTSSITSNWDSKCGLGMISRQRFGPTRSK